MSNWRAAINSALRRTTGYQVTKAAPHQAGPLSQESLALASAAAGSGFQVDHLDDDTWVARRNVRRRREVVQIGPPPLRTHLVLEPAASRGNMHGVQRQVGAYLAHEQVAMILRSMGINVVLDVGANVGQYAGKLREHGYTGRIVSFEPVPELAGRLRKRAQGDEDWMVLDCALGEEDGSAEINASPGTLSSFLPASDFGRDWSGKLSHVHTETILVSRLDSLWEQVTAGIDDPRVYLKMDTQGFDLQAFRGGGDRTAEVLALQSEVACVPIYEGMPRLPESLALYEAAGFEIAGMYPVTFHRQTLRVIEFDMIMVRARAAEQATLPEPDSAVSAAKA